VAGSTQVDIVLDGPPDLTAGSGRFVEVEADDGHSIAIGAWTQRPDGYWSPADRRRTHPAATIHGPPGRGGTVDPTPYEDERTGRHLAGPVDVELTRSVDVIPPGSNRARWPWNPGRLPSLNGLVLRPPSLVESKPRSDSPAWQGSASVPCQPFLG
jgi:hypothetical protein